MKNITVVYYSGTGNTEMMAEAVAKGAEGDNINVKLATFDDITVDDIINADTVAFGCPACGNEELEDGTVQPFIDNLKDKITGKNIALFGSYGWGGGPWMEAWEEQVKSYGANLVTDSLILLEAPDDEGIENCTTFGNNLR